MNARLALIAAQSPTHDGGFVVVEFEEPALLTSRAADFAPYWGGAQVGNGATGTCSSGFAVGYIGGRAMLTAGHCYSTTDGAPASNGVGTPMGSSAHNGLYNLGQLDTVKITVSSVQGFFYDGVPNTSEFGKAIKDYGQSSYVGLFLCTSGAFSGALCNIVVDSTEDTIVAGSFVLAHMVTAHQIDGASAGGTGDSGGPVFSLRDNGANATAQGTMSAQSGDSSLNAACTGITMVGGVARTCSSKIFYFPIKRALDYHAVFLITQ